MKWLIINETLITKYREFVDSVSNSGIWHYPEWLNFQLASGRAKDGFIFAIADDNDNFVLGGLFLVQYSSFKVKFAYIPAGLLYKEINDEIYSFFIHNIDIEAKARDVIFTQLDSITKINDTYSRIITKARSHSLHEKLPIPSWTNIIDLTMTEDEILAQMKQKGRYNIKLAQKKGVIIEEHPIKDVDIFYNMLLETTTRDRFRPNPPEYYKCMLENIPSAKLLFAHHESDIICGGIFTYTANQGLYYYGASSNVKRNLMSPYLLQWTALLKAREVECRYYDFMGLADPNNPKDQLESVTEFKLKFGGEVVQFQTPYHIIHKGTTYFTYKFCKKVKKIFVSR